MFVFLHLSLSSHLGVVKVEAGPWLGRGGIGVDSQHEGLFTSCNGAMNVLIESQALLTDESSRGCLALDAEDSSTHVGLVGLHPERHWDGSNPVHAEVRN